VGCERDCVGAVEVAVYRAARAVHEPDARRPVVEPGIELLERRAARGELPPPTRPWDLPR
jgi:hypothetical protein